MKNKVLKAVSFLLIIAAIAAMSIFALANAAEKKEEVISAAEDVELPDGTALAPDADAGETSSAPRTNGWDYWDDRELTEWDAEKYGPLPDGLIFAPDPDIAVTKVPVSVLCDTANTGVFSTSADTVDSGELRTTVPTERGALPYGLHGSRLGENSGNIGDSAYSGHYFTGYSSLMIRLSSLLWDQTLAVGSDGNWMMDYLSAGLEATLTVFLIERDDAGAPGTIVNARALTLPGNKTAAALIYRYDSLNPASQYYLYFTQTEKTSPYSEIGVAGGWVAEPDQVDPANLKQNGARLDIRD
jgi:hypothetical protein